MTPREEFFDLMEKLREKKLEAYDKNQQQSLFEERLAKIYFEKFPRRKKIPSFDKFEKEMPKEYETTANQLIDEIQKAHKDYLNLRRESQERLTEIADSIEIPNTEEALEFEEVGEMSYSTQPNSYAYAKHKAQIWIDHLEFCGIKSEMVIVPSTGSYTRFQVHAYCREEDFILLRHKTTLTLKEQIRRCWKGGVNPRVYYPFLPHGYEESEGLNFFGGFVK